MVSRLHDAGIEVILDVVFNHTAEGNELGPTLCFRGIDNKSYYALAEDQRYYVDYTGCGNSLNLNHPHVLKMVTDALRYWVREMHVDGFRFDLAATLARRDGRLQHGSNFLTAIEQDPVLSRVKLIAEPWDLGPQRLSRRRFSGRLVGMERSFSRRRPAVLARRRVDARDGDATHRFERYLRPARPASARQRELRHVARRLHLARSRLVRRKA